MIKISKHWTLVVVLSLLLTACKSPAPAGDKTQPPDVDAIVISAAQTADAQLTQVVSTPTQASGSALQATPGAQPSASGSQPVTTTLPATPRPISAPAPGTPAPDAQNGDAAEFVTDVTIPDGTKLKPNETFIKTWRLRNNGSATWTTAYMIYFTNGEQMGAPGSLPIPANVAPGQSIDVSVPMTAPAKAGSAVGLWMLRGAQKNPFGVGPGANEPIYVQIAVAADGAVDNNNTPIPGVITLTPTAIKNSGDIVIAASMLIDNASITGCPHTFTFTAQFSLKKATTVSYRFEAQADFPIKLPDPATVNLNAGPHSLIYTLTFTSAVKGWARLHITVPEEVVSNNVNFVLICK